MSAKQIDRSVLNIRPGDFIVLESDICRCEVHGDRIAVTRVCCEHDFKANTIMFIDCCEECQRELSLIEPL